MTNDEQFENNEITNDSSTGDPSQPGYTPDAYYPEDFQQGAFGSGINIRVNQKKRRTGLIVSASILGGILLALGIFFCGLFIAKRFMDVDLVASNQGFSLSIVPKGDETTEVPAKQQGETQSDTQTVGDLRPIGNGDASIVIVDPSSSVANGDEAALLTNPQIAAKVKPSVVSILGESLRYATSSTGSGIVMSEDGYIITNYHVVEGVDKLTVVLDNGQEYNALIVGLDQNSDLAVIKINTTGLTPVEFGNSDAVAVGDPALAIGNPYGIELQGTVTAGIISAINRDIAVSAERTMTLIQTDASINPGNSGGPLVNKYGQVIGINTIKLGVSYFEGLGFAIPINTAKPILDELIKYGAVLGRPAIGITGWVVTESYARSYKIPAGVFVETVDELSDAYKKGIKNGDVIIEVNGVAVSTMADINKVKETMAVGDVMRLTVSRNGETINFDVTLIDESLLSK